MTKPTTSLDVLPPGEPEDPHASHLVRAPSSTPNFGFLYRPVGLSQREEDALRIHVLLMFYDDHALLWSSLEQHFHALDEKRLNAAIALLEEVDAVEVDPAPAPNPWSPDDALVRLIPHPSPAVSGKQSSSFNPTLPLPWPGSHVYSPVVPATPGPPAFGFPVLLSETDYHAEQASQFPFPGSVSAGAAAFSSGRQSGPGGRRKSGSGSRGSVLPPGLTISHLDGDIGPHQGSQTPRANATTMGTPNPVTTAGYPANVNTLPAFDARRLPMTVTPPSSDRWVSEESSPWIRPVHNGEQGWMDKRLGQAMSGVDFLDLDQIGGRSGGEEQSTAEEKFGADTAVPLEKPKEPLPETSNVHSLSLGMDDTLDIVKHAVTAAAAAKTASPTKDSTSSSRTESKKGRERTGLGVSFAHADEINEYHSASRFDAHDEMSEDEEHEHAKTPIANPAAGWMRRLEKAYSYG